MTFIPKDQVDDFLKKTNKETKESELNEYFENLMKMGYRSAQDLPLLISDQVRTGFAQYLERNQRNNLQGSYLERYLERNNLRRDNSVGSSRPGADPEYLFGSVTSEEAKREAETLIQLTARQVGAGLVNSNCRNINDILMAIRLFDVAEEVYALAAQQDPSLTQFPIFKPWAEARMYLMPESATRQHCECLLGIIPPEVGTQIPEREYND